MDDVMPRPLLFLDVDGPIIPFGAASPYRTYGDADASEHPLLSRVDPGLGARLLDLPCELVWATTWMDDANELIAPRLELPPLAVVDWPEPSETDERAGLHWKTRHLVAWAAGRPFAWVDDEITGADRAWVERRHPGEALLLRVAAERGLGDADFALPGEWLSTVAGVRG